MKLQRHWNLLEQIHSTYHFAEAMHQNHFAEEMRGSDEIQLPEGPILLPCPLPGFIASEGKTALEAFLLEGPAVAYDVEAMCAPLSIFLAIALSEVKFLVFDDLKCIRTAGPVPFPDLMRSVTSAELEALTP